MKVYVRKGEMKDVPWMLKQLEAFSAFYGTRIPLFDYDSASRILPSFIEKGFVAVAERSEKDHIGLIVGAITPHLFNPKIKILAELLWWVDPAYRNTRAGYLLLKQFVSWGRKNVDWVTFSLEENSPVNEKTIIKQGFRKMEHSYLIEVGCYHGGSDNGSGDNCSNGGDSRNGGSGFAIKKST